MRRFFFPVLLLLIGFSAKAQYTSTINSNRPGGSQGAFAVGGGVVQFEMGATYGQAKHNLLDRETDLFGVDYQIRYGVLREQLEFSLTGEYLSAKQTLHNIGGQDLSYRFSNFKTNVLGAKYLIYDPARAHYFDEPNYYSWKANHRPKWWSLLPAVSVYAGMNILFGDHPGGYPFYGDEIANISPRFALITQNNWGSFVFVMNFVADRFIMDHRRLSGIFTLTHAMSGTASVFVEYQVIKGDFYSDDLFRFGGAYLLNNNLQFDISGLINFKDTPSRWQVGIGASYRLDYHERDEVLTHDKKPEAEAAKKKKKEEQEKAKKQSDKAAEKNTKDNPGELGH